MKKICMKMLFKAIWTAIISQSIFLVFVVLLVAFANGSAAGGSFVYSGGVFTQIQYPATWSTSDATGAYGINNNGQIVGSYDLGMCEGICGFLDDGGSFSSFKYPGAAQTLPWDINNNGQIVGWYTGSNGVLHGFLYDAGTFSSFNYPGVVGTCSFPCGITPGTRINGINDSGQIVGTFVDYANGTPDTHAFLYASGSFSSLNYPGAQETFAYGINDSGQVVGWYEDGTGREHAFLYSSGTFTSFNYPGATTYAYGLNDMGDIVGSFQDATGVQHGFIYSSGTFSSVNYPRAIYTYLYGINDMGQIVGNRSGDVPEPSSILLVVTGLASIVGTGFHKLRCR